MLDGQLSKANICSKKRGRKDVRAAQVLRVGETGPADLARAVSPEEEN